MVAFPYIAVVRFRCSSSEVVLQCRNSQRMDFKKFATGAEALFNRAKQVDGVTKSRPLDCTE